MLIRLALTFFLLLSLADPSFASFEKPPILRINSGTPAFNTVSISTDAKGQYLAIGADDMTVRVLDAKTGQQLSVLRPPIYDFIKDEIEKIAISPNGDTIACAVKSNDKKWESKVYIFDRKREKLSYCLTDTAPHVQDLKFSPDGKYVAVLSESAKSTLYLYETSRWKMIGSETIVTGDGNVFSLDFSSDNKLVVSAREFKTPVSPMIGLIQVFSTGSSSLTLVAERRFPDGSDQPGDVKYSPDGKMIAVGHSSMGSSKKAWILDGETLKSLWETEKREGSFHNVSWSVNGDFLYLIGKFENSGNEYEYTMKRWSTKGIKNYPLDINYSEEFVVLPDETFILASSWKGVQLRNTSAKIIWEKKAVKETFFTKSEVLYLNNSASTIQIGNGIEKGKSFRFNVQRRSLDVAYDDKSLTPPKTSHKEIKNIGEVRANIISPNPRYLQWQYYKISSYAYHPKERGAVLSSNRNFSYSTLDGKILWSKSGLKAKRINIPSNGNVVVAYFGKGRFRWYKIQDGKELLSLHVNPDMSSWVLWTPSGYYDTSPGGEELIGWHVNRDKDQAADFFPASRFRSTYYRPDVIDKILETLNEAEAIRLANVESGRKRQQVAISEVLPPVVSILSHYDGAKITSEHLNLKVSVRSPSGKNVTSIKLLIDGRPVSRERGITLNKKQAFETRTININVPPRDCEVSVIAETADSLSVPATVRLVWAKQTPQQDIFVVKPKLYVLAIGVSDYEDPELKLELAAKDAQDFAATVKKQNGGLYREVVTKTLTNDIATKDDILDGLDWLVRETTSRDVAMLFLAGHGINDPYGTYYYLPQDANLDRLRRTGVVFADIKNTLAALAGKALFFVDTCHSGNVMGSRRAAPTDINGLVNELSSAENGAVVFASSTGRQYSLEDPAWGNGAFTKALVEGLSGKADYTGKGKISINMLDLYLSERVKELTKGRQTPTTTKPQTIQDFPIAVKL